MAKEVYTIEIIGQLAESAATLLNRLGYRNVLVRIDDGYKGWPDRAPFDRIILTAAPPELPIALIDQLKRGGKLLAPVGDQAADAQEFRLLEKAADGKIMSRPVLLGAVCADDQAQRALIGERTLLGHCGPLCHLAGQTRYRRI